MSLQVLYADTLFLSNFVMNLLALSLCGAVMHLKYKRRRLILSASLGGIYALLAVLLSFPSVLHIVAGGLLSALLVHIAFGFQGKASLFFRSFVLFYFSSVLLGGGIEALFSLLEQIFGMRMNALVRPADVLLVLGFTAYFLLSLAARFLGGGALPRSVTVRIRYGERSVNLPLLVDSGCMLSDPITGKGAILVSAASLRTVLPREVIETAEAKRVDMPKELSYARRCRLLPMVGVGGERLLLAFRPDEVRLLSDGGTLDVWVAIYTSDTARFGGCRGLFPSSLLYGREGRPTETKTISRTKKGGSFL